MINLRMCRWNENERINTDEIVDVDFIIFGL